MKNFIRAAIIVVSILTMQNVYAFHNFSKEIPGNTTSSIDLTDTVVFDISQAVIAGNKVTFPIYIITDDTVNSLDFSFMYDEMNFSLDTIINLTTYLQSVYNYNSGTLYFSSYSLQEIDHNTNLISVELNMLGHYLCSDDLNSVLAYLNGDVCSVKIVECLSDAVPEKEPDNFHLYPNPVSGILNVSCNRNSEVQLLDLKGSIVFSGMNNQINDAFRIDVSRLPKGFYVLSVRENEKVFFEKIMIE